MKRGKDKSQMTTKQRQDKIHEWKNLLREFEVLALPADSEGELIPQLERLIYAFDRQQVGWRKEQRLRADDFNILRTMRLTRKELCHSDILAWLLDPDGSHAQRELGFHLFLKQVNLPKEYAGRNYRVIRELSGEESQLDIVIEAEGEFIIGIENKIDSEEGDKQTEREWRDLQRRKQSLSIPTGVTAFFLTPDESKPLCKSFRTISWQVIANVFEAFADEAGAELVRVFARHYAETIRHDIATEIEDEKNENE
jgi:hypothetical protein